MASIYIDFVWSNAYNSVRLIHGLLNSIIGIVKVVLIMISKVPVHISSSICSLAIEPQGFGHSQLTKTTLHELRHTTKLYTIILLKGKMKLFRLQSTLGIQATLGWPGC